MKKLLTLLVIATLAISSFAFAENTKPANVKPSGYKAEIIAGGKLAAAKLKTAPTDIIINNASYDTIVVDVIDGGFSRTIRPREALHVFSYDGAFPTRIRFYGPYGSFMVGTFCPRASITVYGYSTSDVVVDDRSCQL